MKSPLFPAALFLDRDGTLIIDKVYLSDPEGVELYPKTGEYLQRARAAGCLLFLFTNQSGIGRGYYKVEEAVAVNQRMCELLGLGERGFDATCIAPEAPDTPQVYRKPSPRFILETLASYGLRPEACLMVGDSEADVGAALAAGIPAVALRTGKKDPLANDFIMENRVPVYEDFAAFAAHSLFPQPGA